MARTFTVAGRQFSFEAREVEAAVASESPEPIREHFVVVGNRRFPPKQVLELLTGLDRADFTTHQARRILTRLGFQAARRQAHRTDRQTSRAIRAPQGGQQADVLRPYVGQWVALAGPCDVLVAGSSAEEVLSWLARHGKRAPGGMFRVPATHAEAEGAAPA